jgi:shikimate kinase
MERERVHPALQRRSLVLVGLMGSGKSTVGPRVAAAVGLAFADLDALVESSAGQSIRELIGAEGEPAFRSLEAAELAGALGGPPMVLATGGGAVLSDASRRVLPDGPVVVWLQAPVDTLVARLDGPAMASRPLLDEGPAEVLERLGAERDPLYAEVASLHIDTAGDTPEGVAASILEALDELAAVEDTVDTVAGDPQEGAA